MSFDDSVNDSVGQEVALRSGLRLATFEPKEADEGDPSVMGWPPTLAIELALRTGTPRSICTDYGLSREEWDAIRTNPHFTAELARTVEALRNDGMAFKARSQLQANELLKESWRIIHDPNTPYAVKADLIKSTIRWSGLDASKDAALQSKNGTGFSININLA